MNDLIEIKKRIYNENKVYDLLKKMKCQNIRLVSNRYEAQLPENFGSNNSRSVQVYMFEGLPCRVRSRHLPRKLDIFGLVSYVIFELNDESEFKKSLPKSKRWICDSLGFEISFGEKRGLFLEKEDPLKWLRNVRKQRPKKLRDMEDNIVYEESILSQYIMHPYYDYFKEEGIPYQIQKDYEIGYDILTDRIIFPIRNKYGEIISIKGRTTDKNYKKKGIPKFLYLYPYNKQIEWYNWNSALYEIMEKNEVIIFEAEKSCWKAAAYGYKNTLAIGGSDISLYQIEFLKQLPIEIKIIFAFDKDKTQEEVMHEAKKFGRIRKLFVMWDKENILSKELKQSPVDVNKETFDFLYEDSLHRRLIIKE
ncbi:hypothetical protein BSK59_13790 [Paenibacillus odorifer]|uniref:toprim domain-containing protein n=1 Tax=Paenibacillus odorifer TaxID=189426 RepID=UPI00096C4C73|nr:toprim domain-containing protein [Paenibacillus odorifer]OME55543.1 hypothetical protein BSK59_13790 [Paenibacillus odorifer]